MSVLIKGAEMPKSCITCTFKSDSMFNRTMWCEWLDDPLGDYTKCDEKWRHPDCPLVEVPTPHGRLIDADALKKEWLEAEKRMGADKVIKLPLKDYITDGCVYDLDNALTIIEAEEGEE